MDSESLYIHDLFDLLDVLNFLFTDNRSVAIFVL
jgi:hypothetical protein